MAGKPGKSPKARPRGWWYPWIFVAMFAIIISVNGVMIFFAIDTFPGLETDGHYTKGLEYNKTLEAVRRQQALGWTGALTFAASGRLSVTLHDKAGRALDGLAVHVVLLRPTHETADQTVDMLPTGPGRYGADITLALPGQWKVNLYARRGDDLYHRSDRIQVP